MFYLVICMLNNLNGFSAIRKRTCKFECIILLSAICNELISLNESYYYPQLV